MPRPSKSYQIGHVKPPASRKALACLAGHPDANPSVA